MIVIKQPVRVRKYNVDCESLRLILTENKKKLSLSNNNLAQKLNISKTKVDHWFRNDNCFAIPDANIWFELKEILQIDTDIFDKAITTFEIHDGVYDMSNRIYDCHGIAPTITCNAGNEKILIYE